MSALMISVDRLLRGEFTDDATKESPATVLPARQLTLAALALGAIYGLFLASYGLLYADDARLQRLLAPVVKVPLLFLLTLVVTFPSLYVFSALAKTRLTAQETLRLLAGATCVILAVLASLGPIAAFFAACTESYRFMVLLHFAFFSASGLIGVAFLRRCLALALPAKATSTLVFKVWIVLFGLVGAQMGWVLRPFLGNPEMSFVWFRPRQSHVFAFIADSARALLH